MTGLVVFLADRKGIENEEEVSFLLLPFLEDGCFKEDPEEKRTDNIDQFRALCLKICVCVWVCVCVCVQRHKFLKEKNL